ncbi:C1 family peptidase [Saccharicrinis fermentans]|uniref:Peptidase C1A papain C-terminal domain-containing protein n=1 Tax=Saccharicrinis fermentans DSM 9555 = JCM 21142 TaxID=869213 RepID=W7YDE1_9BACT|nr:C1 family peptidase [Saccharicrinis fermentans]GAF05508.1 hypothetical protein JCM21142_104245 [Saccharicrinis fermentans DSM 9555 = JCM 21142]
MKLVSNLLLAAICLSSSIVTAQQKIHFESIAEVETTPVKSQGRTGTCWAYSTVSFIESEIIRMGAPL